jgi:hypothetical protein
LVDRAPNILKSIRRLQLDLQALQTRTRPESLTFVEADPASGVPCTSSSFIQTHECLIFRSGQTVYVDVAAATGSGSVMEFYLIAPDVTGVSGPIVASPAGGTMQIVRVTFPFPDSWTIGDAHLLYLQARRVSGSNSTTVRVLRAVQR